MVETLRILHLEDSEDDASFIEAALANSDLACTVRVAGTRDEFLDALGSAQFDLVLSDFSIPGIDAASALETLRQRRPAIPIVFVSGHSAEQHPGLAQITDCIEYVAKAELENLVPAIRRALRSAAESRDDASEGNSSPAEMLIGVVQALSLARDLASVIDIVRHAARRLTGADGATFVLREGELCYYADEDAIAPLWKGMRFPMSICISGWAMLNRQPAVIEDIYADSRIPADAYRPTFVKSLAMVPIRTASPIGAIGNYWAAHHKATGEEVKLLQALADSTSIAMENVQLYSELEQRVRERTAQLEAANEELEAFSFSVSHDLRAPLRHIDGFSQLLLTESVDCLDDAARDYLERIRSATGRMNRLIEDLLKLSRIAQAAVRRETVDLTRMAREIAAVLQGESPQRRVEFVIEEGITAVGDPSLLCVVLENLLANAWKYTSKRPHARIAFGIAPEGRPSSHYYVKDDGAGFNMAEAGKLFGAFQRLHTESEFPGTGVGLATVKRIVEKHGGRVWAEAAVGEGATFSFTLP